ncbi:MAG: pyruvate dehydrogenase (acetyl-transferring) E1 component subunit alpha [Rickettsiales bacterium]|nr:MAG: pyruvate dehydrogenase (acetyl-transferring) E1 component subunit alpha [Rickettsiales bacterium]
MFEQKKYKLKPEEYVDSFEKMLLIRRFEEKCGQFYGMGLIGGFCHLYIGQEAVIAGITLAKDEKDSTITSYRDHGHIIMSGADPKYVMAELMGRSSGCSRGKGGSMHLFNKDGKFYGGNGIVGAQVPIGTGLGFAEQYNGTNNLCFTFFGDGATNQGQVYEAFNMAALWKLPVIYVIENNEYSMGTSLERSTAMTDLYRKGESFNIPGFQADGMDIDAVYNATIQATEFVRGGNGPVILEVKTYRYRGHSMSDPAQYRSKEEVEEYKQRDPVESAKKIILDNDYASADQVKEIEKRVKAKIAEVAEFATSEPFPSEDELYTDIFR